MAEKKKSNPTLAVVALAVAGILGFTAYHFTRPATPDAPPATNDETAKPKADEKAKVVKPEPTIAEIVADEKGRMSDRLDAVQKLSDDMTKEEIKNVRAVLCNRGDDAAVRNDVLVKLTQQKQNPQTGLMNDLVIGWEDSKEDDTWQGYCLQHFATVFSDSTPNERKKALKILFEVAGDSADKHAGTAVLSLQRIAAVDPKVKAQMGEVTAKGLKSEDPVHRATAMDVATQNKDASVLPKARKLATDPKAEWRERLTAIAALGEMGVKEDRDLLTKLSTDGDSRVKRSAIYQLKKLNGKLKR